MKTWVQILSVCFFAVLLMFSCSKDNDFWDWMIPETEDSTTTAQVAGYVFRPALVDATADNIAQLKVPAGFVVKKLAENLGKPRILAATASGHIYFSDREAGTISLLRDENNDGVSDETTVVARLPQAHGLAIHNNTLWIATVKEVYSTTINSDGTLTEPSLIIDDLPDGGQHPNRTLAVGPDGMLYITIGSTCNACPESNPMNATVARANLDGTNLSIFAKGLRNTIGLDWHPQSNELWGLDHGIDWLGDDDQKEELNLIKQNAHYGWPFIYGEGKYNPANQLYNGHNGHHTCYERKIMVDVKHLSLASRRMLVEDIRKRPEFLPINQPLICTHAGFTGISYKDIPDYMVEFNKVKRKNYSYILWGKRKLYGMLDLSIAFNPSSINLYDEDIIAILRSGGMIGLNLDKRILGYTEADSRPAAMNEFAFEEEYISNAEKEVYLTKRTIGTKVTEFNCITMQEVLQGGVVNPAVSYYHLCHFMAHVLHFIKVVQQTGDYNLQQAFTQICIGSDFDGLINPVWCCPVFTDINVLKKEFRENFMSFAKANKETVMLPQDFDINRFTEQLFFENGKNFILTRL